jgi:hypothetical protein
VELLFEICPLPAEQSCQAILGALEGRARRQVLQLPSYELNEPRRVLAFLQASFGSQKSGTALLEDFVRRQQARSESIMDFALAIHTMSVDANKAEFDLVSEKCLRDRFVRGLRNASMRRELQRFMRANNDCDFADVRDEALRLEKEMEEEDAYVDEVAATATAPSAASLSFISQQLAALSTEVQELKSKDKGTTSSNDPVERRCFWCDLPGHVQRDCPARSKYLARKKRKAANAPPNDDTQKSGN